MWFHVCNDWWFIALCYTFIITLHAGLSFTAVTMLAEQYYRHLACENAPPAIHQGHVWGSSLNLNDQSPLWLIEWTTATQCSMAHLLPSHASCRRYWMPLLVWSLVSANTNTLLRHILHFLPVTARNSSRLLLWPLTVSEVLVLSTSSKSSAQSRTCHVGHSVRLTAATCSFRGQTHPSASEVSLIAAPVIWNTLPPDLRSPHNSRQQFRSKLKTHLFRQAYTAWFLWEHCSRV